MVFVYLETTGWVAPISFKYSWGNAGINQPIKAVQAITHHVVSLGCILLFLFARIVCTHWQALALLEEGYSLQVTRVDVLEGDDSEKKIKQMKTFSGRNTVPQVTLLIACFRGREGESKQKKHRLVYDEDIILHSFAGSAGVTCVECDRWISLSFDIKSVP